MKNLNSRAGLPLFSLLFLWCCCCWPTATLTAQCDPATNTGDPASIPVPNVPSSHAYDAMMGINASTEWDAIDLMDNYNDCGMAHGVTGNPYGQVASFIRSFHLMNHDYDGGSTPASGSVGACDPIPNGSNQCACWGNPNATMAGWQCRYLSWRNDHGVTEIHASLEAFANRNFPDKWFSSCEWGNNLNDVYNEMRGYTAAFIQTFCPPNGGGECLVDVLEIGNEPWGQPGIAAYQQIVRAVVDEFKLQYGNDPTTWPMRLAAPAMQAYQTSSIASSIPNCCNGYQDGNETDVDCGGSHARNCWPPDGNLNCPPCSGAPSDCQIGDITTPDGSGEDLSGDYIGDLIPCDLWEYIDGIGMHPYSYTNCQGGSIDEHPESANSEFQRIRNMVQFQQQNGLTGKDLNVTEYGWDSDIVGLQAQANYLVRNLLVLGRYGVKEAVIFEGVDNPSQSSTYRTSGLWTATSYSPSNRRPGCPKPSFFTMRNAKSSLANLHFLNAVQEGDGSVNAYLLGDAGGKPTHLIAWYGANVNGTGSGDALLANTTTATLNGFPTQLQIDDSGNSVLIHDEFSLTNGLTVSTSSVVNTAGLVPVVTVSPIPVLIPLRDTDCAFYGQGILECTRPTCDDGILNGYEEDVDCGGPDCDPCFPMCFNGIQDGDEEGVDCGGTSCEPCPCGDDPGGCDNVTDGGAIQADEIQCGSYDPANITNVSLPVGGSGTLVYQWESSTDGGTNWTVIAGATNDSYDPSTISQSTLYRRLARRDNCPDFLSSNTVEKAVGVACTGDIVIADCPDDITVQAGSGGTATVSWTEPTASCSGGGGGGGGCTGSAIPGFTHMGEYDNADYYLSTTDEYWVDAKTKCEGFSAHLATVEDAAENNFIKSNIGNNIVFIGLSDVATEGTFEWVNGEPVTYTNWSPNPPNNTVDKDFATMAFWTTGPWDLLDDITKKPYVCELECGGVGPTPNVQITRTDSGPANGAQWPSGTYTVTYVASDGCGNSATCSFTVTVNPPVGCDDVTNGGTIAGDEQNCDPYDGAIISNQSNASGGSGTLEYQWQQSTTSPFSGYTNISGATADDYDPGLISQTTYFRRAARRSGCTSFQVFSNVVTKTVGGSECGGECADNGFEGFTYKGDHAGNEYYLSNNKRTWEEAVAACTGINANLVIIDDVAENNYVFSSVAGGNKVYIGLSDVATEGTFVWVDGSAVSYHNFPQFPPAANTNDRDFTYMASWSNGVWDLQPKGALEYFVCELPCDGESGPRGSAAVSSKKEQVLLYPNPTTGDLKVELPEFVGEGGLIKIYSSIGTLVYQQSVRAIPEGALTLHLHNLQAGMYLLSFQQGEQVQVSQSFVVEKH